MKHGKVEYDGDEYSIAEIESADVSLARSEFLVLDVTFDYADGMHQGIGSYVIDADFIERFMKTVGVDRLSDAVGEYCLVKATHSKVKKIVPIHPDHSDKEFDIEQWQEEIKQEREDEE
jgi:phosphoglucomutase